MPAQFESVNSPIAREPMMNGTGQHSHDNDVVISGFSGRFPESDSVEELKKNLFEGVDMVTDDERRWPAGLYGLPTRTGKLKTLNQFDPTFFGVHGKQAHLMDPQLRLLLETTYEAIVDAGINPQEIRGSKTGVYIGVSTSESNEKWSDDPDEVTGYALIGCCRAMFPNRISFAFDFTGPSYAVDTACSSSMFAMHQAISAIRSGECDAAIVGGCNLLLKPIASLEFHRLGMLSPDGMCKAFDADGKGYVRSETVGVFYLQKAKDARRVYATVIHSKTNTDGNKVQGITYPNGEMQNKLMREVYLEAGVNPADVVYVEAHGTGTKVGDPQEINSIANLFCKGRKAPLLLGSVKSNLGHAEAASGMGSLAKLLIAMEAGVIPGNLHFKNPNENIPSLKDGSIQVIDRNTPWKGGLVAVNSFGFGGANAHILLRSNPKPKLSPVLDSKLPKLVLASGRTEEAVQILLDKAKEHEKDDEFIALLHDTYATNIPSHAYRGYSVLGNASGSEISQCNTTEKRPIWFIFSGMGSQWSGMGKQLLCIEPFQRSLQRCADALKPEGLDLMNIILNGTPETFENVMHCFVSIAAIQVALVDVLAYMGIHPDGIIGHSVGELGCAYADGTFTPEQTMLAAYWRGRSILNSKLPPGAMAAVGLSWEDVKKRCPPDIFPACNNSSDSVTVSGPVDSIHKFAEKLKQDNIFVKVVDSSGVAFHSKYIAPVGQSLRVALERIIPNPKPRTSRWISTSIPDGAWNNPLAQLSSAAYHVNNLLSPVLFQQGLTFIHDNAITIEVAPHCLMQAILRRSLPKNVTNVGLHKRDNENNLGFFLENIGKVYTAGAQPEVSKLYPSISYPVGRGTPMLNTLVGWDHSTEWSVANFSTSGGSSGESIVAVDLSKESDAYLSGHKIDGRILFPATGYLVIVWKTFAKLRNVNYEKLPVVFEDVKILRATILPTEGTVKFLINIFMGTGEFEICESGSVAVTGKISVPENVEKMLLNLPTPVVRNEPELLELKPVDIYKELRLRGYDYTGVFRGIKTSNNRGGSGELLWSNWISFIDTMLQISILDKDTRALYLPTRVKYVAINPMIHLEYVNNLKPGDGIPAHYYKNIDVTKSGGIEIRKMKVNLAPKRQQTQVTPYHDRSLFVPYVNPQPLVQDPDKAKTYAMTVLLHLVRENAKGLKVKGIEIADERPADTLFGSIVLDILYREPSVTVDFQIAGSNPNQYTSLEAQHIKVVQRDMHIAPVGQDLNFIIAANVLSENSKAALRNLSESLKAGGFLILEECGQLNLSNLKSCNLMYVSKQVIHGKSFILLKKIENLKEPSIIQITEKNFHWLEGLKAAMKKSVTENQEILLVSQGEELLGMAGLINCLRMEEGGSNVRYVFIQDKNAPKFSPSNKFYSEQLEKQFVANVLKGGNWGSYRHLPLDGQKGASSLQVEHAYINVLYRGDLSSLRWIESPLSYYQPETCPNMELFHVYYAPLNFRDVMLASGKLPPDALPGNLANEDCILGLEFSGRNSKGQRVMAMVPARGLATTVVADPGFSWIVPDKWTLEEASTIPVAYSTSYYALFVRGGLKRGESVLIHAGTGGVGQASISIALHAGCTVFTTVGTPEKRECLKKMFPQLTDRNIGNSRDTSFEQMILNETNGRGVDVVLNSLAEEKLQASIRCLAIGGRFLEIGKFDLSNDATLGMSLFLKNTAFHGILLDAICEDDCAERQAVVKLVQEGIENGAVRPLPATVFSEQQIEQSFRFMATGKHIGKVVLKIRDEEKQKVVSSPAPKIVAAIPRTYMNPEKSYILVGGLGGFGIELADWMITRGAKHVVLTSRSGIRTGYQSMAVRRWRGMGVNIAISTVDVTTLAGARQLLKESSEIAPIGGIFNLAAVLADKLIKDLNENDFVKVTTPKVIATKHLDAASREMCPSLDYFVAFSSVSCGKGNLGQTNYGLANSAMERIVEQRQANGLPGLAIQWGAIGDVGLILDTLGGSNDIEVGGTTPQRIGSCLETMDVFLQQPHPVLSSCCIADQRKFQDTSNRISIVQAVANILGIKKLETINNNVTLADLGMDSLMGTEIKQTLERNYDTVLSPQDIRNLTFEKLQMIDSGAVDTAKNDGQGGKEEEVMAEFLFQADGTEIVPVEALVELKTKKSKGVPVFFVHAIEGMIGPFKSIASELERPAWGFQCVRDAPLDSITELASFYIKEMKKVQKKGPYNLTGYSFGACVAFEMALQLENAGEKTILTLLDGSPEFVRLHCIEIGKQASRSRQDILEDNCRKTMSFFITQFNRKISYIEAYTILKDVPDDEIWNKMVKVINHADLKDEDLKVAGQLFHRKIQAAYYYRPSDTYKGDVTLVRIEDNFIHVKKDYGLSEICTKDIRIEELPGNHRSFLTGESGSEIAKILQT
ncbi:PREDICTED: fatty acid synthase [Dufourea novaeangliae]|uniref:Fatty acid synthase n=1 Tax=Dufourea novaeangliae TaxID=178035 RepID=A0A154PP11_DUFNO|nr:PREDICTED: fatty acid synthase [Dufourea novaeangliae]KZC13477.1 Fatty acid synthase [Dufourea novaeangliae]